ncbi:diaminopimelate epimerase [soil metagenome]
MPIPFTKMHGCGNDYLFVDAFSDARLEALDWPALTRAMSQRHTGVGSDGVILLCAPAPTHAPDEGAHLRMRIFNADGSEAEMCGNGVRCLAKFAVDRLALPRTLRVQTGKGIVIVTCAPSAGPVLRARVDMGAPLFDLAAIPVAEAGLAWTDRPHEAILHLPHANPIATFVSMGNPHAVIFVCAPNLNRSAPPRGAPDPDLPARLTDIALERLGPQIEKHRAFPRGANAHFVECASQTEASMRTWERGSGATQACGTGACAVLVAGVLTGRLARRALLRVPGGALEVEWDERTNHVLLTGPAVHVCDGEWPHE